MIPIIDFTIYSGDSRYITVIITDSSNNPVDITSATIQFKVSKDSITVITKSTSDGGGITITGATNGQIAINLTSSDTSSLNGTYDYQIRVTDTLNNSSIVLTGNMVVKKTIS